MSDSKWILLSEKFPKFKEYVLVTIWGNLEIGYFDKDPDNLQLRFNAEAYSLYEDEVYDSISAWMPLPKPYTE